MADLSDRGQILLIAAFALAVTFVALALVVNSAIFTENLASRGEVAGSSDAMSYQHQVRQSVGTAIAFANRFNHSSGLESSIKESLSDIGETGGSQQARGGQLVNVTYVSDVDGTRIAHNESGGAEFRSQGGDIDWQMADFVDRTRAFEINVTNPSGLETSRSNAFVVRANETMTADDIWSMWIYNDGDLVVEVETADGPPSQECSFDTFGVDNFEIDVTRGLVNGERCHALQRAGVDGTKMWFATGMPSGAQYNISVENGDDIGGNYSLVMEGNANSTHVPSGPNPTDPYHTDALYQVSVEYVYVTSNVRYVAEIRVAPGEHP